MKYEETMKDRFKYAVDTLLIEKYRLMLEKRNKVITGQRIVEMDKEIEQLDGVISIIKEWRKE